MLYKQAALIVGKKQFTFYALNDTLNSEYYSAILTQKGDSHSIPLFLRQWKHTKRCLLQLLVNQSW